MKRKMISLAAVLMAAGLTACGSAPNAGSTAAGSSVEETADTDSREDTSSTSVSEEPEAAQEDSTPAAGSSNILIVYFSVPEDINTEGIDADAGASVVVRNGQVLGNLEYMAGIIQEATGGDLFRIETVEAYPLDHESLVDQAAEEQDADARPELSAQLENPEQYDTVLLGYPNWWGDMPMPVYTFLESCDLSGKTIIPFTAHGGSGFSNTVAGIAALQPGAQVSENGLSISRNDVAGGEEEIRSWAEGLGL